VERTECHIIVPVDYIVERVLFCDGPNRLVLPDYQIYISRLPWA